MFGSDTATRMVTDWPNVAMQIITLVSRDMGVLLSLGDMSAEVQVAEHGFEVINFSDPKDNLLKNRSICNNGEDHISFRVLRTS